MFTKTLVATIAIWTAGIGSAAAFAYTVSHPPVAKVETKIEAAPIADATPPNIDNFKIPGPLKVPPRMMRSQIRTTPKTLKCSGFKPMAAGPIDHAVRYCE